MTRNGPARRGEKAVSNRAAILPMIRSEPARRAEKGGQQSGGNLANDPQRAGEAGQKDGGQQSGGSFTNDPERASEAGPTTRE